MMKKHFAIASLFLALFTIATLPAFAIHDAGKEYIQDVVEPEPWLGEASFKLLRGITNIATSPVEIPKQIVVTTADHGVSGLAIGPIKGIGMTVMRVLVGAWETVTFLLPNSFENDYEPIMNPEFVWNPSVRTEFR